MRKVWYHQIWIQNYFGFIVLILLYISPIFDDIKLSSRVLILSPDQGIEPRSLKKFIIIIIKKLPKNYYKNRKKSPKKLSKIFNKNSSKNTQKTPKKYHEVVSFFSLDHNLKKPIWSQPQKKHPKILVLKSSTCPASEQRA